MSNDSANSSHIIDQLLKLRLAVGFLGQGNQSGWWDCNFLDSTGLRFLETTFPRTARQAALRSTTDAACTIHDKALGRIGSYHLFRLPLALEDLIEHAYDRMDWLESFKKIESRDSALEVLSTIEGALIKAPAGPFQVGVESDLLTNTALCELTAHYRSAFLDQIRCYPYFAAEKNEK